MVFKYFHGCYLQYTLLCFCFLDMKSIQLCTLYAQLTRHYKRLKHFKGIFNSYYRNRNFCMLHFQIQSIRDLKTTNVKANLLIIIIIKSKAYYNSVSGLYS